MAQTKTKIIKIIVQTTDKALKSMTRQFDRLNKSVKKMSGSLSTIRNAFLGLFAAVGVREITRTMDTFQLMQDRLTIFTGSAEKASKAFYDLALGARFVKSSIASLGDAYNKIAIATSDLGFSSEQVLGIVIALQQTLRLSGAAAQEASSVFLQFGQALSLGRIQGQELRAVMLGNAKYTQLLADKMGVAKGVLKQMGEQGKLTNDKVLTALLSNFKALNTEAAFLNQTFEQTFIITVDAMKIKLKELNEELGLSKKFAAAAKFFLENFNDVMVGLGVSIGGVALAFGTLNLPLTATIVGLTALGVAAFYVSKNIKQIELELLKLKDKFSGYVFDFRDELTDLALRMAGVEKPARMLIKAFTNVSSKTLVTGKAAESTAEQISKLEEAIKKMNDAPGGKLKELMDRVSASVKEALAALLNSNRGRGLVGAFAELNMQFTTGVKDLRAYAYGVRAIRLDGLYDKMAKGKMTVGELAKAFEKINEEFIKLNRGEGIFAGIELGAKKAANSVGTLATQISGFIGNTFNTLEDQLFDFVKKGRFEFRKFAQAILDDLTRVIIRMSIIRPLAGAVGSAFGPSAPSYDLSNTTTAPYNPNTPKAAKGLAFDNSNILPFAKGGVINTPTLFPFSRGTGLMAEEGPEAIMPLARDSQGRLGVRGGSTVVNVINQSSDTETQTSESTGPNGEKQIDVLIVNKVSSAIGEGRMDKVFKQVYGLNRRGA